MASMLRLAQAAEEHPASRAALILLAFLTFRNTSPRRFQLPAEKLAASC